MELNTTDIYVIESALLQHLEKLSGFNKEFKPFLKDEFYKHWEDVRKLHTKFCNLQGEIEQKIAYMKKNPKTNQALNIIITVQKEEKLTTKQ